MTTPSQRLELYAIYEHPKDYPEGYIVRVWHTNQDGTTEPGQGYSAATLDDARALLPEGSVQIAGRDPSDPVIAETWM